MDTPDFELLRRWRRAYIVQQSNSGRIAALLPRFYAH
jgi:hypothetical protein